MHELVALIGPAGPAWVDRLRRAWDDGDAVLPVDPRLPGPARDRLIAAMAPTVLDTPDGGRTRTTDGRPVQAGDALVVATSGTTGAPKGVVLTHDAVTASAQATTARLGVDPDRHRWLACLPLSHVGGLSVVTRALLTGTPLEVHPGFDAEAVTAAATERGATHVSLVATALARIDPSRFACIVLGGSAPPADRPANTVATYGMTETGSGVVYDGHPLDDVEVRIVDGEIHLRGPMLLRAYRDGTVPTDFEGWLATGDRGEVDPDTGELTVHGRASDLIITGGENVWPATVEAVLGAHPLVAEVAVVGRADPEWGQRVVAVVVPADRHHLPTLDQLRSAVKDQMPAFAAPRELELVERLPTTALGKVVRTRL
ncbi:MAG: long-chain fatty acid--CoA ligase [Acidimicrobiales bacterium]|nr:long-chain fatty acid--CoA ligase [Acidimicrobiales bacterium]